LHEPPRPRSRAARQRRPARKRRPGRRAPRRARFPGRRGAAARHRAGGRVACADRGGRYLDALRRALRPRAHDAPPRPRAGDRAPGPVGHRRGGDRPLVLEGSRDDLTQVADAIAAAGLAPAALELVSPALARRERWVLAVRLAGSAALVAGDEAGLRAATGGRLTPLRSEEAHLFWTRAAEGIAARPVACRIGGLPDSSDELLDLLQHQVVDE